MFLGCFFFLLIEDLNICGSPGSSVDKGMAAHSLTSRRSRELTPLQYSCLENPMDGGAWKASVHGVAEGQT